MSLPDFLVIGAMRSGTSWLDDVLRSHPGIYLPARRKEVHFFDAYYDRGIGWYEGFFPPPREALRFRRLGEVTPKYLYDPAVPERIRRSLPGCKLMAILRNPVDRAYSHYGFSVRDGNERRTFEEFLERYPGVFSRGLYGRQVKRYLEHFPREDLLLLVFEKVLARPERARDAVAGFLGVDPEGFSLAPGRDDRRNASFRPRFGPLYARCRSWVTALRRSDMDPLVNWGKRLGVKRIFRTDHRLPPLEAGLRAHLFARYAEDVALLEAAIGEDLSVWRPQDPLDAEAGR